MSISENPTEAPVANQRPSAAEPPDSAPSNLWRIGVTVAVSVTALAAGGGAFGVLASLKPPPAAREAVTRVYNVDVFRAERTTVRERLSAFGTSAAVDEVVVSAQVAGRITALAPGRGGQLEVGQTFSVSTRTDAETGRPIAEVLVVIDDRDYRQRTRQARSRLVEIEAETARLRKEHESNVALLKHDRQELAEYREEYDRFRKLRGTNSVTASQLVRATLELRQYEESVKRLEKEVDLYDSRRAVLEARLEVAKNDVGIAELDVERTTIRVPFDGRISEVMVDLGHYVRPGEPIARLTAADRVEVPLPITLTEFARLEPRLRPGSPLAERPIVFLAENVGAAATWSGRAVRAAPVADRLTRTVEVFVEVDNREQSTPLLPGTFAHALVEGPVLEDVLLVPRDAILTDGRLYVAREPTAAELKALKREEGAPRVWKVEARTVRVSRTLETLAIVESGVEDGERIVLTNLDVVHDGAWIETADEHGLDAELAAQRIGVVGRLESEGGDVVPPPMPVGRLMP